MKDAREKAVLVWTIETGLSDALSQDSRAYKGLSVS